MEKTFLNLCLEKYFLRLPARCEWTKVTVQSTSFEEKLLIILPVLQTLSKAKFILRLEGMWRLK